MRRRAFLTGLAAGLLSSRSGVARAVEMLQYYGSTYATPRAGDIVMARDLTQLRTAVNDVRVRYGLAAYQWTDPVVTPQETIIKAVHVQELRQAIDDVYVRLNRPLPLFDALGPPIRYRDFADVQAALTVIATQPFTGPDVVIKEDIFVPFLQWYVDPFGVTRQCLTFTGCWTEVTVSKSLLDQIQARSDTVLLANGLQQRTMPTMRDYSVAWGIAVTLEAGAVLLMAGGKISQAGLLTIAEGLAAGTVGAQGTLIAGGFFVTLTGTAVIALGIGALYVVWRWSQGPQVPVQQQSIRIEVSPDGLGWDVFEIGGWGDAASLRRVGGRVRAGARPVV